MDSTFQGHPGWLTADRGFTQKTALPPAPAIIDGPEFSSTRTFKAGVHMPTPPPISKLVVELSGLDQDTPEQSSSILHALNRYFFQKSADVPDYFSPFHAWWAANYEAVLGLRIDREACRSVAKVLITTKSSRSDVPWKQDVDFGGLSKNRIANVRFFTAVQDFKIDLYKGGWNPYRDAAADSKLFDSKSLIDKPALVDATLYMIESPRFPR